MTRPELERKLAALARQPVVVRGGEAAAEPADVELAMADLISDDNGEIVLFNDSGLRSLILRTDAAVVAEAITAFDRPHGPVKGEMTDRRSRPQVRLIQFEKLT